MSSFKNLLYHDLFNNLMLCVLGWVSGTVLLLSELLNAREKADLWLIVVISFIEGFYLLHYVKGHILIIVIFWNAMYYLKLQWKSKIYKLGSCGTLIQLWIDDVVMSQWYYLGCLCCLLHTLDLSTLFLVNPNSTVLYVQNMDTRRKKERKKERNGDWCWYFLWY